MSRYDSDNNIPERNYMARFDPGDDNATELVPMRPSAPQGYSGYQGYPGHSSGYPEDKRGSQPDAYARNGDSMYPPGARYNPEPRPNPNNPPHVQNNYRSDSPRSYNGRPFTPERGGPYRGYPVEPELVAYNSHRYEHRPDVQPDNDPDRHEKVRDMTGTSMTETTEETGPRVSQPTWAQLITPTSITTKMSRDLLRPKSNFPKYTSSF